MKKLLVFLLVSLFTIFAVFPAFAIVDQSEDFYVADYADVFSRDFEERIISLNSDLEHYCSGAQLVVVTVDYLDGMYSDEYAMKLFNTWGVGDASENNGMLLLLAVKENKAWLTVGRGISLSTSEIDEMFEDYFWYDFDRGNYETATENMLNALTLWYVNEYNVDTAGNNMDVPQDNYSDPFATLKFIIAIIIIVYLLRLIGSLSGCRRSYRTYRTEGGSMRYLAWMLYYARMHGAFRFPTYRRSHYRHTSDWNDHDDDDDFRSGGSGGSYRSSGSRGGSGFSGFGGFGGFGGGGGGRR